MFQIYSCLKWPFRGIVHALRNQYGQDYLIHYQYIETIKSLRHMQGKHERVLLVPCSRINQFMQHIELFLFHNSS